MKLWISISALDFFRLFSLSEKLNRAAPSGTTTASVSAGAAPVAAARATCLYVGCTGGANLGEATHIRSSGFIEAWLRAGDGGASKSAPASRRCRW